MMLPNVPFTDALKDVSSGNVKIPQGEFLSDGQLAVVDQGQSLVAGFTDNRKAAVRSPAPLIVFGDHTRAIKFIDFPFAMGADGVKVLQVRDGFDPKFVYHYLRSRPIPSAGYSRHFKFLKEVVVPKPPLPEQRRIAAILDHADALRAKRRQVLAHLDSLTQSIFTEMFSEGAFPLERAGALMPDMRNGLSPATAGTHHAQVLTLSSVTQGPFDPSAVKAGVFAVEPPADKRITDRDFLICRGNGNKALVGVGTYSKENRSDLVFPDTVIAGTVDTALVRMPFLEAAWNRREVRAQIEAVARTTNGTYKVNQKTLAGVQVPVPPLDLQDAFATRVARVGEQDRAVRHAAEADDELFASLQSRAFRGEL